MFFACYFLCVSFVLFCVGVCGEMWGCGWGVCEYVVVDCQGRSQPHSSGWARVPLSLFFLKFLSIILIFSQIFLIFELILASGWATLPLGKTLATSLLIATDRPIKWGNQYLVYLTAHNWQN